MLEAARTSETLVDNYFTRHYIPEDNSELHGNPLLSFIDESSLMTEAARTSETSVDNYFTRHYIPEEKPELQDYSSLGAQKKPWAQRNQWLLPNNTPKLF
jgi:hypothetical protein